MNASSAYLRFKDGITVLVALPDPKAVCADAHGWGLKARTETRRRTPRTLPNRNWLPFDAAKEAFDNITVNHLVSSQPRQY